jgi:hypothetical protein
MNNTQTDIIEIELINATAAEHAVELAARELKDAELLFVGGGTGNVIF